MALHFFFFYILFLDLRPFELTALLCARIYTWSFPFGMQMRFFPPGINER